MAVATTESVKRKPKLEEATTFADGVALRLTRRAKQYHCDLKVLAPFPPLEISHDARSFSAICSWLEELPAQVTPPLKPTRTTLASTLADELSRRAQMIARAQAVERAIGDILANWAARHTKG